MKQNRGFHRRDHTLHQGKVLRLFFLDIVLIIPELLACSWCWCELVHAVPMLSSRLILSLPSTGCTVYRHVHSLPIGTVWFGCPNLDALLGIFSCTYVHSHYKTKYRTHNKMGGTFAYIFNHTDLTIGENQTNLLFLTPSVRHSHTAEKFLRKVSTAKIFSVQDTASKRQKNFHTNFLTAL